MNEKSPPQTPSLELFAPAKVNLYLEVIGKRPDGYHEVRTVMQAVSLFDRLRLHARPDGEIRLRCSDPSLPSDAGNLVYRAASRLQRLCGTDQGVAVELEKHIPAGGGLGGGSSDAALVLRALPHLWRLDVPWRELYCLAVELGSDVAFFLRGGTALCEGRGERITPVRCAQAPHFVLVIPGFRVSTESVYQRVETALTNSGGNVNSVLSALEEGDMSRLGALLRNDLQEAAFSASEELSELAATLDSAKEDLCSAGRLLCGSGASFLLLYRNGKEAQAAAEEVRRELAVRCVPVRGLSPVEEWESLVHSYRRAHFEYH